MGNKLHRTEQLQTTRRSRKEAQAPGSSDNYLDDERLAQQGLHLQGLLRSSLAKA